jgi:penicillin-insensitive murein endopeptidase
MRGLRLVLNAAGALGLMLAAFEILAAPGSRYFQPAWAEGPTWTASMQGVPAAQGARQSKVPAAPASVPASLPSNAAIPAVAVSPQKPAAPPPSMKKANARELFGAVKEPANLASRSIGFYAHGCLAGGKPLPVNGPAWQVMRLSRNRNWGHPSLIRYIERFAEDAKEKDGWPGLLVGDLSMPRGGPMPFGHASHQVGLDVDIWYKPTPDHELSTGERENIKMESFLLDPGHVNPEVWKPEYEKLLRRAVSYPEVARVFVNPAIKKWLCDNTKGDRGFLRKITPIMGHDAHFHVRLVCPANNPGCENQVFKSDEGCGKVLDKWIETLMKPAKAVPGAPATKLGALRAKVAAWRDRALGGSKKPPFPLGKLPPECEAVLKAGPATASAANAVR